MKDVLQYKNFIGSVHFDADDEIFHGKIEGVNDLITFEGKSVSEIKESFEQAVEDYIDICKNSGKQIHIFTHPDIPELLNLQNVRGQAKPYQIKQLIQIIERHNLQMEEDE